MTGGVAAGWILPVEVLMKSPPAAIAISRRLADVVVGDELAGLEDHLEVRFAARLLDRGDLVEHLGELAREEGAAVDHHVDLVGAELDGAPRVGDLHFERHQTCRKAGRDRRDVDPRPGEGAPRDADEVRIDADRGDRRHARVARQRLARLAAHLLDLAGGVFSFERRQVDHRDREVDPGALRLFLDRPLGERRGALLHPDRVDARHPGEVEPRPAQSRHHGISLSLSATRAVQTG